MSGLVSITLTAIVVLWGTSAIAAENSHNDCYKKVFPSAGHAGTAPLGDAKNIETVEYWECRIEHLKEKRREADSNPETAEGQVKSINSAIESMRLKIIDLKSKDSSQKAQPAKSPPTIEDIPLPPALTPSDEEEVMLNPLEDESFASNLETVEEAVEESTEEDISISAPTPSSMSAPTPSSMSAPTPGTMPDAANTPEPNMAHANNMPDPMSAPTPSSMSAPMSAPMPPPIPSPIPSPMPGTMPANQQQKASPQNAAPKVIKITRPRMLKIPAINPQSINQAQNQPKPTLKPTPEPTPKPNKHSISKKPHKSAKRHHAKRPTYKPDPISKKMSDRKIRQEIDSYSEQQHSECTQMGYYKTYNSKDIESRRFIECLNRSR